MLKFFKENVAEQVHPQIYYKTYYKKLTFGLLRVTRKKALIKFSNLDLNVYLLLTRFYRA